MRNGIFSGYLPVDLEFLMPGSGAQNNTYYRDIALNDLVLCPGGPVSGLSLKAKE